jgi:AraC family ethanolamine operon transcriptional activator
MKREVGALWGTSSRGGPDRFEEQGDQGLSALGGVASANSGSGQHATATVISQRYSDVEAQAESIPGFFQEYSQFECGRFEGIHHAHILSQRAMLCVEATNRSIRKQFHILPGEMRIGFHLNSASSIRCHGNGVELPSGEVSVNLPMTALDMHFANYHGAWITLDFDRVRAMMSMQEEPSALERPGRHQIAGPTACMFREMLAAARQELLDGRSLDPTRVAAFENILFSLAASVVEKALDCDAAARETSRLRRAELLRKACELIDGRLSEGLTMSELCTTIGASRRCLENIFMEAFDVSPYQYVRTMRLNAIRRALLSEENAGISIGDIASRWGVWHLSRFAADYRSLFGELPSESRRLLVKPEGRPRPRGSMDVERRLIASRGVGAPNSATHGSEELP